MILGCSCPLAAAVEGHPETCLLAEALLADVIGAPVRQTCDTRVCGAGSRSGALSPLEILGAAFRYSRRVPVMIAVGRRRRLLPCKTA